MCDSYQDGNGNGSGEGSSVPFTNQLAFQTAFTPVGFNSDSPFVGRHDGPPAPSWVPQVKDDEERRLSLPQ